MSNEAGREDGTKGRETRRRTTCTIVSVTDDDAKSRRTRDGWNHRITPLVHEGVALCCTYCTPGLESNRPRSGLSLATRMA